MTTEQLIAKFNPANAGNLNAQDLETMRQLTDEQIDELAKAYPNQPTRRPYLRLYDTSKAENKQLYNLSTWQNLRNVRKFSNMKNLVPYDFIATPGALQTHQRDQATRTIGKPGANPRKVVVDLTAQEAANELRAIAEKKPAPAKASATSVENITANTASVTPAKAAKPATSAKKAASVKTKTTPAKSVEKMAADPSTTFPPVE